MGRFVDNSRCESDGMGYWLLLSHKLGYIEPDCYMSLKSGYNIGEFMVLPRLGSMIHAGKGTSFGLGRYGIKVLKKQGLKEAGRI